MPKGMGQCAPPLSLAGRACGDVGTPPAFVRFGFLRLGTLNDNRICYSCYVSVEIELYARRT